MIILLVFRQGGGLIAVFADIRLVKEKIAIYMGRGRRGILTKHRGVRLKKKKTKHRGEYAMHPLG